MRKVYTIQLQISSMEDSKIDKFCIPKFCGRKILYETLSEKKALDRYYGEMNKLKDKPVSWVSKKICDAYIAELYLRVDDLDEEDTYVETLEADEWYVFR